MLFEQPIAQVVVGKEVVRSDQGAVKSASIGVNVLRRLNRNA